MLVDKLSRIAGAPNRGVRERDLGQLLPDRHDPDTAACLLEMAFLSNPAQARRLEHDDYRDELARGMAECISATLEDRGVIAAELGAGDGPPFVKSVAADCWATCQDLSKNAAKPTNPNTLSAARLTLQTGIKIEANPYAGINEEKLNAVIRAGYQSIQMPEVLLALWAKEGSTRMETAPRPVPQASTAANAKAIFRSGVFFVGLGTDHFIVTTRPAAGGDNQMDATDAGRPGTSAFRRA